jgi:hypothetical protein
MRALQQAGTIDLLTKSRSLIFLPIPGVSLLTSCPPFDIEL